MRAAVYLVCIFISLSMAAQNQTGNLTSYSATEGLSNNTVHCITQDSRQFLWIGTNEGLNRFDGYSFKKYFHTQHATNDLSHNCVFNILEYKYGQLLIATSDGLSVFNTISGEFENERIDFPAIKAGLGEVILSVFKNSDGQIWINHGGELDVLDSNLHFKFRFTDLAWAKTLKGSMFLKKGQTDKKGRLWLASDTSGLQVIDFSKRQVYNYRNNPEHLVYLTEKFKYMRSFFLDEQNQVLWYAPWGAGLIRHDLVQHTEQVQNFGLSEFSEYRSVNSIIQKDSSHLLCAVGLGLYEADRTKAITIKQLDSKPGLVAFESTGNQFWEGTSQGLIQLSGIPSFAREFELKRPDMDECSDLIIARSGNIYCTYLHNELFEINRNKALVNSYSIPSRKGLVTTEICEDADGKIWIGTSSGVFFFDIKNKSITQPPFLPAELTISVINFIYRDRDDNIWIGTRRPFKMYCYKRRQQKIERITNSIVDQFTNISSDSRLSYLTEDNKNNLWIYSYLGGGIVNFNKVSGTWKLYPTGDRFKNIMVTKGISSLYAGDNNDLWFTQNDGNGLTRYDYLHDSITQFTRSEGLASDYIQNVLVGYDNNLWLLSDYGITKFNLQNHSSNSYRLKVVPGQPVGHVEALFDNQTNSLVYGLDGRLLIVDLNALKEDSSEVVPIIDRTAANNKEFISANGDNKIRLNHLENNITVAFTGVNFSTASQMRFAYQLGGLDTGWQLSGAARSAQYANLAPGDYVFKIKTATQNGSWSKVYEGVAFTIRPAFWQTAWFVTGIVCFIAFLVFWFVRRRIRIIRTEAELKHKLAETEMTALRSQMNPHFIFNCLNAIDNLIQTNQTEKATTYLSRFAKLIRAVLDSSTKNTVPFYKDFATLELFLQLEQFRCNNKFSYELLADKELLDGDYKVPPLIIQPFAENAIHHGLLNKESGERKLLVHAILSGNSISYCIKDNGVGRKMADEIRKSNKPEHRSYGIQITTERIYLHNQESMTNEDVVIKDLITEGNPAGTEINIKLKIQ